MAKKNPGTKTAETTPAPVGLEKFRPVESFQIGKKNFMVLEQMDSEENVATILKFTVGKDGEPENFKDPTAKEFEQAVEYLESRTECSGECAEGAEETEGEACACCGGTEENAEEDEIITLDDGEEEFQFRPVEIFAVGKKNFMLLEPLEGDENEVTILKFKMDKEGKPSVFEDPTDKEWEAAVEYLGLDDETEHECCGGEGEECCGEGTCACAEEAEEPAKPVKAPAKKAARAKAAPAAKKGSAKKPAAKKGPARAQKAAPKKKAAGKKR